MRFNDAIVGAAMVALALAVALEARSFPSPPGQIYGAWFFPMVLAAALGIAGLALVVRGIATASVVPWVTRPEWSRSRRNVINLVLLPAVLVFYVETLDIIGFVPAAIVVVFVLAVRLGTAILPAAALAVAASLAVSQVFGRVLRVPLPSLELGGFSI